MSKNILVLLKDLFLQLLFPRVCPVCGEILPKKQRICPDCYRQLYIPPQPRCDLCSRQLYADDELYCPTCTERLRKGEVSYKKGYALWAHTDAAKNVLYGLKFSALHDNADFTGAEMARVLGEEVLFWKADVIIPVPLHKKRQRERGFNQAQLLAERFANHLEQMTGQKIPVDTTLLKRRVYTKPQRTLRAERRQSNVQQAFRVTKPCRYRRIILFDDIWTTGATLEACARTLKDAGACEIYFLTASMVG